MSSPSRALLPEGLTDLLPPDAEREEQATRVLLDVFRAHGYERVRPPLLEFEDALTEGLGAAGAESTFRLMDPVSHRMLGFRADITPQVARIASTRLAAEPRPLRLCYAGEVLRIRGATPRPERQVRQIGAELIGFPGVAADVEVLLLTVDALRALGIGRFTIDVTVPSLARALLDEHGAGEARRAEIAEAFARKDLARLAGLTGGEAGPLAALARAAGPVEEAVDALAGAELPAEAAASRDHALEVLREVRGAEPDLALTVDPAENRGFGYYAGIGFAVFAEGAGREIAFGGRYRTDGDETATGLSFLTDSLLRVAPAAPAGERVFVPRAEGPAAARKLRAEGRAAVLGLDGADGEEAARAAGCTHILRKGRPAPLKGGS